MTLAILCSGQGGQVATMFDVFAGEPAFAGRVRRAGDAAGFDLVDAVRAGSRRPSVFDNAIAQPLICAYQLIAWASLEARLAALEIAPRRWAGYSVGELSAHGCAGGLTFDDTIGLARERAAAMDAVGDGDGLLAIRGLSRTALAALSAGHATFVAIVNGDDHCIVGGASTDLDALGAAVVERGGSARRLPVGIAAHTPRLAAAVAPFRERLSTRPWRAPSAPVLAGIDATVVGDVATAIDRLSRQLAETVRWSDCMDALVEGGITTCLELGPGNALARLMRERHPACEARSIADFRGLDAVVEWVRRSGA